MSEETSATISSLPLITLHLTERCNSRCISCDYWRHGERDLSLASVEQLIPQLKTLGTRVVLISGGEPLVHPLWRDIAALLRSNGLQLWLLTAGLALAKHAERVLELFDAITVSLDGIDRDMYLRIRGLDAFKRVCDGIDAVAERRARIGVRVTVQRTNYAALRQFVDLAHTLRVDEVSFLAADVSNLHAFGRREDFVRTIALSPEDLPRFETAVAELESTHAYDFTTRFIAENPAKLRRMLAYFTAVCGLGAFPAVRCNAPEFSAVLSADGNVHPCFFIAGPASAHSGCGLGTALDDTAMQALRSSIRNKQRAECMRCVCSLWQEPHELRDFRIEPPTRVVA